MFTGIVEALGEVVDIDHIEGDAARLTVRAGPAAEGVRLGDSVAVDGVCLTVTGFEGTGFEGTGPERGLSFDVMGETLSRSTLAERAPGDRVNLERALRVGDRLGGHVVQGHVDGTGRVLHRRPGHTWESVRISLPAALSRYVVEKGSIAVDGVSLTVAAVVDGEFTVGLIPATLQATTLGSKLVGGSVNLEVDVLAKHVERLLDSAKGAKGEVP